jgi:hypothetical protein
MNRNVTGTFPCVLTNGFRSALKGHCRDIILFGLNLTGHLNDFLKHIKYQYGVVLFLTETYFEHIFQYTIFFPNINSSPDWDGGIEV